jgi:hypothetical protein
MQPDYLVQNAVTAVSAVASLRWGQADQRIRLSVGWRRDSVAGQ